MSAISERWTDVICNVIYLTGGLLFLMRLLLTKKQYFPRWNRVAQIFITIFLIVGPMLSFIRFFWWHSLSNFTNRLLWKYEQQLFGAALAMLIFMIFSGGFEYASTQKKKDDAKSSSLDPTQSP
jgi:hypothetical protein